MWSFRKDLGKKKTHYGMAVQTTEFYMGFVVRLGLCMQTPQPLFIVRIHRHTIVLCFLEIIDFIDS